MVISRKLSDRMADAAILLILALAALVCILPILNTLAVSLSDKAKAEAGLVLFWPIDVTFASYEKLLSDQLFFNSFWISVKRVVVGGTLNMLLCIVMAYPLSKERKAFRARNLYMWFILFTMLFSGGLIPWYILITRLGLIDSFWALILPGAVSVFNVILLMNFFRGVPKELEEAALMDGAGPWYTLWKVYVPVSLPAIATITLFTAVGHWNSFFDGMILMNKPQNYPLQTYIQQLIVNTNLQNISDPELLRKLQEISSRTFNAAKIFVSMIPILMVYPYLQRFFITGIRLGAVKE